MKIALICNTTSAFPLLDWLHSQGVLVAVGTVEQNSDFFSEFTVVCQQRKLKIHTFSKQNLAIQLTDFQNFSNANLVLVLGFPYKIPKSVLHKPTYGFYNIHFGKLPKYGGSFPVFWQVKNQEKEGVLTIHQMDKSFDTGPIAVEISISINPNITFGILEANFSMVAIQGVYQLLDNLLRKSLILKPQKQNNQVFFSKPTLKDLIIDWQKMDAHQILALIKASNPWNRGAIARINGIDIKIIEAKVNSFLSKKAGEVFRLYDNGMEVSCINDTALDIKILYSPYGYLEGENMGIFGINNGSLFETISI